MKRRNLFNKAMAGTLAALAAIGFTACDSDQISYDGPDYVMFADSLQSVAIQDDETYHDIPAVATNTCDHDRTYAVEIIDRESNAIEGLHYDLASNTVTIKAGERAGSVKIRGHYSDFEDTDSIGVTLRLIAPKDQIWDLYGDKAQVVLVKVCPFDINRFVGHAKLTSTFFAEYMQNTNIRLIETVRDPEVENGIILKDYFYDGYDIKVKFNTRKPLEPILEMDEQVVGTTADAFQGNVWGDDKLRVMQPASVISYYNMCQGFFLQYMTFYVKDIGTVGTYANIVEWISDSEYEYLKQQGY